MDIRGVGGFAQVINGHLDMGVRSKIQICCGPVRWVML